MQTETPPKTKETTLTEKPGRLRLEYLDGLRGLAALYVVIYHTSSGGFSGGPLPHFMAPLLKILAYGHFSVAVFIVLSGYCLALPVARSADGELRGGFWAYIMRRARRILPPYYAAIALALLLIALIPALSRPTGTMWDGTTPAFSVGAIGSHLLLAHNLSPEWIFRINGPLWSVATEWQIYFLLPFVFLPLWRRAGLIPATLALFVIGLGLHYALGEQIDKAMPWYAGLFGLGAAGAILGFSRNDRLTVWRERIPWGAVASVLGVIVLSLGGLRSGWWWSHLWQADSITGLAVVSLMIFCTRYLTRGALGSRPLPLRLFESPLATRLGIFSYSIYLVHLPLITVFYLLVRNLAISPLARFGIEIFVGVPFAIGAAYLFHRAFERRFMTAAHPALPIPIRELFDAAKPQRTKAL